MKLKPISLSVNLLLTMLGAIVVAQLVTGALFYSQSKATDIGWAALFWAERVSAAVVALDALDRIERRKVLVKLLPDYRLAQQPRVESDDDPARAQFINRFRERIGHLQPMRDIAIGRADPASKPDGFLSILAGFPAKGPVQLYDVRIRFEDGGTSTLRLQQVDRAVPQTNSWLIYSFVFVSALMLGVLVVARGITVPLSRMARAADALGRGIPQTTLLEKGPRELRLAARAFNSMQDRLHRYLHSRTRVLAAMSHDLNTPITRLLLRTEALADPMVREQFLRDLQEMRDMVQGALDMLKGIGTGEVPCYIDISALIHAIQSDYAELGFNVNLSGGLEGPVMAQPLGLRRLLSNLLDNSQRYARTAWLNVSEIGRDVIFTVTDDGPGIPREELERVMEPYFRLEASRDRTTGGTGLGLSIARDIAQSHGGELRLLNVKDGGLQAIVTIPQ
jgi:signal transduction histidine kinase